MKSIDPMKSKDYYLQVLEHYLSILPYSERIETVMKVKAQIDESIGKNPTSSVASLLALLGRPESLASRILSEKGIKSSDYQKKSKPRSVIKTLFLIGLGFFLLLSAIGSAIIWKLTPLVKIDEENHKISLLGGLINLDGDFQGEFHSTSGSDYSVTYTGKEAEVFKGERDLPKGELVLKVGHGDMVLENSNTKKFRWECDVFGGKDSIFVSEVGQVVSLSMEKSPKANCKFWIPESTQLNLQGLGGKILINEPHYHVRAQFNYGDLTYNPDPKEDYKYKFEAPLGEVPGLSSTEKKKFYRIELSVKDGNILSP